jgi:hypothetical protein
LKVSTEVREVDVYAVQDIDWPSGVFFAPKEWHTGFIVTHQLPKTPDTLWFCLFSRDNFQAQAFSELAQLPPSSWHSRQTNG